MSPTTYDIDGTAYTAAELLDARATNPDLWERASAIQHAECYPDGCREPGHRCDACHARLGEPMHATKAHKVGARRGYFGHWEYACKEPGCRWER